MARSVNEVTLVGNVGSDPELRTTASEALIARLSLATNRQYKDAAGRKIEETEWHRLTAFGAVAKIVGDYVRAGEKLYIRGRLHYSESTDDDGNTRYWTEIIVQDLVLLGTPRGAAPHPMPDPARTGYGEGAS